MEELMTSLMHPLQVAYHTARFSDLAKPMMFGLWLVILLFPLRGIDRRDPVGCMMYSLYSVAAGVALVFAIPQKYVAEQPTLTEQLSAVLGFAIVAASRWMYGAEKEAERQRAKDESKGKKPPTKDPNDKSPTNNDPRLARSK